MTLLAPHLSIGVFPELVLIPALAVILLVSAVKLARHDLRSVPPGSCGAGL